MACEGRGLAHQHVPYWTCNKRSTAADARTRLRESAVHSGEPAQIAGPGFAPGERNFARTKVSCRAPFGERLADIFNRETARRARAVFSVPVVQRGARLPARRGPALVGSVRARAVLASRGAHGASNDRVRCRACAA